MVGLSTNPSTLNATAGNYALQLRDLLRNISNFAEWCNGLGGLAGFETAFGLSPADAQTMMNMISYMNTVAGVYQGTATQASEFDFDNALSVLWGGQ